MIPSPNDNGGQFEQVDENLFRADLPVVAVGLSPRDLSDAVRRVRQHLNLLNFQAMVLALKEAWPDAITGVRLYYIRPTDSASSGLNVRVHHHPDTPYGVWAAGEEAIHQCLEPFFKDSDTDFQHLVSMAFSNRDIRLEDLDGLLDTALAGDPRLSQIRAARLALQLAPGLSGTKGPRL